jgi:hypothetical protein
MSMVRRFTLGTATAIAAAAVMLGAGAAIASADDPSGADDNVLDVVDQVIAESGGTVPLIPLTPPPNVPPPPVP